MSTEIVEALVLQKRQAQMQAQQLLQLVGVLAFQHGSHDNNDGAEYRLTKAKIAKLDGRRVEVRSLKTGGVVITVKQADDI